MDIYLDIETIPSRRNDVRVRLHQEAEDAAREASPPDNYKKEETIAKWRADQIEHAPAKAGEAWRKTALDGGYGEVVCIGWAVEDGDVQLLTDIDELALLVHFWGYLDAQVGQQRVQFIGHCIEFDLRFLHHRSVIRGVKPSVHLPYNDAVWKGSYIDTMFEWCGARGSVKEANDKKWGGTHGYVKLTVLCDMLGIELPDDDIKGHDVFEAYKRGDFDAIEKHCRLDVERVREIGRRLRWKS